MRPYVFLRNVLLSALPLSLLTACGGATDPTEFSPTLDPAYTVIAEMNYAESGKAKLAVTRYSEGKWDMTFSEPTTLAGVVLSFDGEAVSASYKGLAFSVPKSALGAKNMLRYVTDALDAIEGSETLSCAKRDDGTWCTDGECSGGQYTVAFNEDGTLASFAMPSQPLTLYFSGYAPASEGTKPAAPPAETTTTQAATTTTAKKT